MSYVGSTHDVGKNTGRSHSGPGPVPLDLHRILLIAFGSQQNYVVGTFKIIERMFAPYLTQFHTGFAVFVTGNKTEKRSKLEKGNTINKVVKLTTFAAMQVSPPAMPQTNAANACHTAG